MTHHARFDNFLKVVKSVVHDPHARFDNFSKSCQISLFLPNPVQPALIGNRIQGAVFALRDIPEALLFF